MICTLTPNPAIDLNLLAHKVEKHVVSRTYGAVYTPNGKGLNVSFTLRHFDSPTTILGFFGGFSGRYIVEGAQDRGCPVVPVWVDGITRINPFVSVTDGSGDEYKFPSNGCEVGPAAQDEMIELLRTLPDMDCLVISGSMPRGVGADFLDRAVDAVRARGAEVVLDISHPHLTDLLAKGPLLIKPNDEELAEVFGLSAATEADVVVSLAELNRRGAKNVLLTMGGRGAYFGNDEGVWHASPAKVEFLSSLCAGDATLAAFLSIWFDDRTAVDHALSRAMATGANVAASMGLGDFSLVDELQKTIQVTRVA